MTTPTNASGTNVTALPVLPHTTLGLGMSTSAMPLALEGTRTFSVVLTIMGNFHSSLRNSSSPAFIELKMNITKFLNGLYNNTPGFIEVVFNSFSSGSIVADSDVVFNKTEATVTSSQLKALIEDAIKENGTGTLIILGIKVSEKGVADPDDSGFETWIIVLAVCFSLVFIILIAVSLLVSKILYCTKPA